MQTRECYLCHRIGHRAFVAYGDWAWCCANDRACQRRQDRRRDETGAATIFVVLWAVALLAVAGLVIDGGYALAAHRKAMNVAEQAARTGADALSTGALRDGDVRVASARAAGAAQSYLAQVGSSGRVRVNGGEVTVTVTDSSDTTILSAVGIGSLPVKASATALSIDEDTP